MGIYFSGDITRKMTTLTSTSPPLPLPLRKVDYIKLRLIIVHFSTYLPIIREYFERILQPFLKIRLNCFDFLNNNTLFFSWKSGENAEKYQVSCKIQLLSVNNTVKASIIRRIKAQKYQNSLKTPPYYRPKKSKSGR